MTKPRHRAPEPTTPHWRSWGLLGLAVAVTLSGLGVMTQWPALHQDLQWRADAALAHADFPHTHVEFSGREALVRDTPPGAHVRARAVVEGVDGVHSAALPADHDRFPPLVLTASGRRLSVSAALGSEQERNEVRTRLRHALPTTRLADGTGVLAGNRLPLPTDELVALARAMRLPSGSITASWQPHAVILAGSTTRKAHELLRARLRHAVPGAVIDDRTTIEERP